MKLRYGLDFGTSNSSIALYKEDQVEIIPLSEQGRRSDFIPTLLYMAADGSNYIGFDAIDRYVKNNVGREFKKKRVRIDSPQIESDVPTWAYIDVDIPGRFFQSLKTFLRDAYYDGTNVFGKFISVEELTGILLKEIKHRADSALGQEVNAVTIGRPVFFSTNPKEDQLAKARLMKAAMLAGFTDINLVFEPYAAALDYARTRTNAENILVFDFGGGTLDYTILRIEPKSVSDGFPKEAVLATGGLTIGGNTFTEQMMENRVVNHFGGNVTYSSGPDNKALGLPRHIIEELRTWYTIPQLNERQIITFLKDVERLSENSREVRNLLTLITKNYGWDLFQSLERTKRLLSDSEVATISFSQGGILLSAALRRRAFESDIRSYLRQIDASLEALLKQANMTFDKIDVIITTGGTSLIPAVQSLLSSKFSHSRIHQQAVFTSVVAGLAIAATRPHQTNNF